VPEGINLETYNADPVTEDVSDDAASKKYAPLDAAAESQADLSAEMKALGDAYAQALKNGGDAEIQPRLDYAPYRSSVLRHPTKDLHHADPETIELYSPAFGHMDVHALEADLTIQHNGEPLGERIVVSGRVLDGDGRPVAGQLVEIWQANSSGRYVHKRDQHPAPLDPNFTGVGRCITGADGSYSFTTTPGVPRTSTSRCSGRSSRSGSSPRCTSPATSSSRWTRSTSPSWTRTPATGLWQPTITS
jgi:protocatechuate 3,4-dioxygenase, beta subunit